MLIDSNGMLMDANGMLMAGPIGPIGLGKAGLLSCTWA